MENTGPTRPTPPPVVTPEVGGPVQPVVPQGKTEWPEVVGMTAEEAAKIIKAEREGVYIVVIPPEQPVSADWVSSRVRIFVDACGKVERPPIIG